MRCPVNLIGIKRGFGDGHYGVDFGWSSKDKYQPIYACDDGVVIYNRYQLTGGYTIIIRHDNGYCSVYGHLLKNSQLIKEGNKVKKGQQIAKMGASGMVTGVHLHFALYRGTGVLFDRKLYVNPLKYINYYDNQSINEKDKASMIKTKHVTAKDGLNVRTKPNSSGKLVKTLKYNEEVETYGIKDNWNIVDNLRGYYCSKNYIK